MTETPNTQPEPTQPEPTQPEPTQPEPAPRRRKFLIAGGAVLAAAFLAGGGLAVGAAIADDHDDDDRTQTTEAVERAESTDSDDSTEKPGNAPIPTDLGTTSADELAEIVDAAASVAEGSAVSLDAGRDGSWDVEFRTDAGDETEVRVASDGTATVVSSEVADADDARDAQGALDATTLDALVTAALGEVDGRIVDVEVDDDPVSPYDVSVLTADGRTVDLALDADLRVLAADLDD